MRQEIIREAKEIIDFNNINRKRDLESLLKVFCMEDLTEREIDKIESLLLEKEEEEEERVAEEEKAEQEAIKEWDGFLRDMNSFWRETRL